MSNPLFVLGIGASAGGLKALHAFLEALEPQLDLAIIVIMHLAPDQVSQLQEVIQNWTQLPVVNVEVTCPLQSQHIYIISPNTWLECQGGFLIPHELNQQRIEDPIDRFFYSLGQNWKDQSIAMILSGSGHDGLDGLSQVKQYDGLILAQTPECAEFKNMPQSAIDSGLTDFIAEPAELGALLNDLIPLHSKELSPTEIEDIQDPYFLETLTLLEAQSSPPLKLNAYRKKPFVRRLLKRMGVLGISTQSKYLQYVKQSPQELELLTRDLFIGSTAFFRNPAAWDILKTELQKRIDLAPDSFRVWDIGCSSGEETFSLSWTLQQCLIQRAKKSKDPLIKIFATDIRESAVIKARTGLYPVLNQEKLALKTPPLWDADDRNLKIISEYRKNILFIRHNLLIEPPFIDLDLVICRNLMIYLQPEIQEQLFQLFRYILKEDGLLFLGQSESIPAGSDDFESLSSSERIYRLRPKAKLWRLPFSEQLTWGGFSLKTQTNKSNYANYSSQPENYPTPYSRLIEEEVGKSFILFNPSFDILYTWGDLSQFLHFPNQIMKLTECLEPGIMHMISSSLHSLQTKNDLIHLPGMEFKTKAKTVNLSICLKEEEPRLYLMTLETERSRSGKKDVQTQIATIPTDLHSSYVNRLENELQQVNQQLKVSLEDLQTSNEELQAANEEMLSTNEELQSSNEELTTSLEELQIRNSELKQLTEDLDNLLQGMDLPVLFLDPELKIRKITPAIKQIFPFELGDLGRPLHIFKHIFQDTPLQTKLEDTLQNHRPQEITLQASNQKHFLIRILPFLKQNTLAGVLVIFIDISDIHQLNSSLKQAQDLYQESFQRSGVGMLLANTTRQIQESNPAFCRFIGYNPKELVGKYLSELIVEQYRETDENHYLELLNGKKQSYQTELLFLHQSGETVWGLLNASLVYSSESSRILIVLQIQDINGQKKAEQELILARKAAENSDQSKSIFLANMSHEIRTPLNAILGFNQILFDEIKDPRYHHFLDIINHSGKNLLKIINNILDLSKIEAGKIELTPLCGDLRLLLQEIEQSFILGIETKGLQWKLSISDSLPAYLFFDFERLHQVLVNLIGNALKFTAQGEINVNVSYQPDNQTQGCLQIEIKDTGIGISVEDQQKVFEAFEQSIAIQQLTRGTGLGLTISLKLVQIMGGSLTLQSTLNEGSVFTLNFPKIEVSSIPADVKSQIGDFIPQRFSPAILVVADDVEDNLLLIQTLLDDFSFEIHYAHNGQEVLDLLQKCKPDLILLDIKMPVMDGLQTLKAIKQHESWMSIPVVALTAFGLKSEEANFIKQGFDHYLRKPFEKTELLQILSLYLQPEETIDAKASVDVPLPSLSPLEQANLKTEFEQVWIPRWEQIRNSLIINELELFAQDLAQRMGYVSLTFEQSFPKQLMTKIQNFDLTGASTCLDEFPAYVQNCLEALKKASD